MKDADLAGELRQAASIFGLYLSQHAVEQLTAYVETLLHWRTHISLTAASTPAQIINEHIADSFSLIEHFSEKAGILMDVGSGAGFPGVPLAIVRPDMHVVLVESRRKRANFLREALRQSKIENAEVSEARAETLAESSGGSAQVITSRALGALVDLLDLAESLLAPGGYVLAMKGPRGHAECRPHKSLLGPQIHEYTLPGYGERLIVKYTRS